MEGLLPLVYRAIKKRRTRREYQCLSSGAALRYNINMSEFYLPQTQGYGGYHEQPLNSIQKNMVDDHAEIIGYRRRHNSATDPRHRTHLPGSSVSKKIVSYKSHKIISCITGV